MKRLREWVRERFDAAMLPLVRRCVTDVAEPVDYGRLALEVASLKEFACELSDSLSDNMVSDVARQVADRVIDQIDTDEIASKVGDTVDASDIAGHIDMDDVCNNLDVSNYLDEIAEKVAEEIDVSECVDYDRLAEALVAKLKEAWA